MESDNKPKPVPTKRWKRRLILGLLGLIVVLILLIALLPTILSTSPMRKLVMARINAAMEGQAEVGQWSWGWTRGVHIRDLRLQAGVLSMKYHSLRMLTCRLKRESPGVAGLVTKLTGCELSHQIAGLAIDALGELGVLYDGSKYLRGGGMWQFQYMFSLGLIIGGGTAQIQKNIISERGLGMPREPRPDREQP